MTELVVNKTEARRNFFNLLKIAESGRRKLVIKGKNVKFHINVVFEKEVKKKTWVDFAGGLSNKVYKDIKKAKKMVDKVSLEEIKRPW